MKTNVIPTSLFLVFCFGFLNSQDTTLIDFQLPEKSEIVDVRLVDTYETLTGHLYQATPDELSILKSRQPEPGKFELVNIPAQNLKHIKFKDQTEIDHLLGASIGFGVGTIVGLLWASTVDVPACDYDFPFDCKNSEERQDARGKKFNRFTGAALIGASFGAIMGTNVQLTIPVYGNKSKYQSELSQIRQFTILKE